jgi:hypothetical protein
MGKTSIGAKVVTAAFASFVVIVMSACGGGSSSNGPGGCGEPAGGCTAGETGAKLQPGCCESTPCGTGTGTYSTCADSCSNVWYEFNGKEYGPCADSNTSCVQQQAGAIVTACGS